MSASTIPNLFGMEVTARDFAEFTGYSEGFICNCEDPSCATGASIEALGGAVTITRMYCDNCDGYQTGSQSAEAIATDSFWDSKRMVDHRAAQVAARRTANLVRLHGYRRAQAMAGVR